MKPLTKIKYIVCWHIGVGSEMPGYLVPQHVDVFREYMEEEKYELEAFLEAPVLCYYLPNRSDKIEMELKKIKVENYAEEI